MPSWWWAALMHLVLELKSISIASLPDKVSVKEQAFVVLLCETPDFRGRWECVLDMV